MTYMCIRVFSLRPERVKLDRIQSPPHEPHVGFTSWNASMHAPCWNSKSARWQCQFCMSSSLHKLTGVCKGGPADGHGHRLWTLDKFTFCVVCGAHSSRRVQHLSGNCKPASSSMLYYGKRLKNGLHPTTGAFLGVPVPIGTLTLPHAVDSIILEIVEDD